MVSDLMFITVFFGGSFGTINLINGILLPAQVEQLVGEQAKSAALGTCAFLGTATQLCQPVIGALSDMTGRRRPWVFFGQISSGKLPLMTPLSPLRNACELRMGVCRRNPLCFQRSAASGCCSLGPCCSSP